MSSGLRPSRQYFLSVLSLLVELVDNMLLHRRGLHVVTSLLPGGVPTERPEVSFMLARRRLLFVGPLRFSCYYLRMLQV